MVARVAMLSNFLCPVSNNSRSCSSCKRMVGSTATLWSQHWFVLLRLGRENYNNTGTWPSKFLNKVLKSSQTSNWSNHHRHQGYHGHPIIMAISHQEHGGRHSHQEHQGHCGYFRHHRLEFTAFMHNNHQRYGHHCPQGQGFVRTVHTYTTYTSTRSILSDFNSVHFFSWARKSSR